MDPKEDQASQAKPLATSIAFEDWQRRIQMATDIDELTNVVRAYLRCWTPEQFNALPWDLGAPALCNSEDIVARAVIANRFELKFEGTEEQHRLVRQMALTLAAAATRLRFLKGLNQYI